MATITSECRTAGLIGGEAVGSSITTAGITIRNCVVGGAVAQEKIPSGSNATKAGGAAGLVGYHAAFSVTVDNCLVAAPVSAKHGTAGAISFQSDRLTLDACNVIVVDHVVGKVVNITLGTVQLQDVFAYKSNSTETALAIAANVGDAGAASVKLNGVDSTWAEATIPVISTKADLNTKLAAIFAGNSVITAAVLEEVVGHDHAYTQEIVDAKYLKSEATCTEPATYYKSCTCGVFDAQITFTFGEPKAHTPSDMWRNDDDNHWHVCSGCLENKTDEAAHTYGEWEVTKPATEVRQGERSKTCTVCGYKVTEKIDKLAPQTAESTSAATNAPSTATGGCGSAIAGLGTVIGLILGMGVTVLKKKG